MTYSALLVLPQMDILDKHSLLLRGHGSPATTFRLGTPRLPESPRSAGEHLPLRWDAGQLPLCQILPQRCLPVVLARTERRPFRPSQQTANRSPSLRIWLQLSPYGSSFPFGAEESAVKTDHCDPFLCCRACPMSHTACCI